MIKMLKALNILNTYSLSILTTSMRSARNFPCARLVRALADLM